jgi:hypothetical protein
MVAGGITLFGYLVYLAADVFENTALFPIALAAIGLLILLSAVWVQRAYPRLVERLGGDRSVRPTLPGGMITAAVPLVIATLIMLERLPNEIRDANEQERLRRAYERSRTVEERRGPPPKSQVPMPP